jgi:hypothetical protein
MMRWLFLILLTVAPPTIQADRTDVFSGVVTVVTVSATAPATIAIDYGTGLVIEYASVTGGTFDGAQWQISGTDTQTLTLHMRVTEGAQQNADVQITARNDTAASTIAFALHHGWRMRLPIIVT